MYVHAKGGTGWKLMLRDFYKSMYAQFFLIIVFSLLLMFVNKWYMVNLYNWTFRVLDYSVFQNVYKEMLTDIISKCQVSSS